MLLGEIANKEWQTAKKQKGEGNLWKCLTVLIYEISNRKIYFSELSHKGTIQNIKR